MVGEGGFEPPKLKAADLQSVPFGHLGNSPIIMGQAMLVLFGAGNRTPNPRPADYKSAALPIELYQHNVGGSYRARTCDPLLVRQMLLPAELNSRDVHRRPTPLSNLYIIAYIYGLINTQI